MEKRLLKKSINRRLLKIQKCDAKGYEKEHAIKIYQQLENIEMNLNEIL